MGTTRAAIGEIAQRPVKFAGHETCEGCHADEATKKSGRQATAHVNCKPATERWPPTPTTQSTVTPVLPDTAALCARCHMASAAKPKGFPQVDPASHSQGLECKACHNPHSPGMDAGGAK